MRRSVVLLLVVTAITSIASASDENPRFTGNHINGAFWKSMEQNAKFHYLYGVIDGITVIAESKPVFDKAHNINPELSKNILESAGRFYVPKGTYEDIVNYIDTFYSDPANLKTPVYAAYLHYISKQKGWSAIESWDNILKDLVVTVPEQNTISN